MNILTLFNSQRNKNTIKQKSNTDNDELKDVNKETEPTPKRNNSKDTSNTSTRSIGSSSPNSIRKGGPRSKKLEGVGPKPKDRRKYLLRTKDLSTDNPLVKGNLKLDALFTSIKTLIPETDESKQNVWK